STGETESVNSSVRGRCGNVNDGMSFAVGEGAFLDDVSMQEVERAKDDDRPLGVVPDCRGGEVAPADGTSSRFAVDLIPAARAAHQAHVGLARRYEASKPVGCRVLFASCAR